MAFVQSNKGYNSGPITLSSVTAGSCLAAWVCGDSALTSTTLPSPWVKSTPVANGNSAGCWWTYANHPGGSASAAITSPPGDVGWSVHEYSGRDTTTPVEDFGSATAGTSAYTSGTVTATTGADLVAGVSQETSAFDMTVDAPWTLRTDQDDHVHVTGDYTNVAAGDYQMAGNASGSLHPWSAATISLKASGGGGGSTSRSAIRRRPSLQWRGRRT